MNRTESPDPDVSSLEIAVRPYDHPDAQRLVWALFYDQVERYGYADPAEADPAKYTPPQGLFVVGYLTGRAATAGGYRMYDSETRTVEIKKMYTLPEFRGRGLGRLVLTELERRAVASGARRSILETGIRNIGALALYATMGYLPTSRYMENRDPAINRAFIKELA
ncbi:GNAT family N-acetyltransferase [Actinoallomurus sp. NPDC050550]|uniref:GNAT family N-acetyltransferase n=1 Tax=Actinoallomurus sp. NPDC050550 TaxID=3154937 RepID=UPI0033E0C0D7